MSDASWFERDMQEPVRGTSVCASVDGRVRASVD
jgi:hypothetical protein